MKIVIASCFFYPENTPRAFRTFELAREFSRQGHEVTVYIPRCKYDYADVGKLYGIKIKQISPGFLLGRKPKRTGIENPDDVIHKNSFNYRTKRLLFSLYNFIMVDGRWSEYFLPLYNSLKRDRNNYDLLISVSLPFSVHTGCGLAILCLQ